MSNPDEDALLSVSFLMEELGKLQQKGVANVPESLVHHFFLSAQNQRNRARQQAIREDSQDQDSLVPPTHTQDAPKVAEPEPKFVPDANFIVEWAAKYGSTFDLDSTISEESMQEILEPQPESPAQPQPTPLPAGDTRKPDWNTVPLEDDLSVEEIQRIVNSMTEHPRTVEINSGDPLKLSFKVYFAAPNPHRGKEPFLTNPK